MKKTLLKIIISLGLLFAVLFSVCSCGADAPADTLPPPHGHAWGEWEVVSEPSCTEEGIKERSCVCGEIETESIPANGHAPVTEPAVPATCTADGLTEGSRCAVCGATIRSQETIPATGHVVVIDEAVPATLKSKGKTEGSHCRICGEVLVAQESIPKLELSESEIESLTGGAVVKVYGLEADGKTIKSQGSGVFINGNGDFVTNAHVIENAYYIKIRTSGSDGFYDVDKIYRFDHIRSDFAICHADVSYGTPFVELSETVETGDTVYALGYPKDSKTVQLTKGVITGMNGIYLVNSAYIINGNSGGALVNAQGELVGITTASAMNGGYLAVKNSQYEGFFSDLDGDAKSPLEKFYIEEKIEIDENNIFDHVDMSIGDRRAGNTVEYTIIGELNEKYLSGEYSLAGAGHITFEIETAYGTDPGYPDKRSTEYVSIEFEDISDLEFFEVKKEISLVSSTDAPVYYAFRARPSEASFALAHYVLRNAY